jgi:hypothetical protein
MESISEYGLKIYSLSSYSFVLAPFWLSWFGSTKLAWNPAQCCLEKRKILVLEFWNKLWGLGTE